MNTMIALKILKEQQRFKKFQIKTKFLFLFLFSVVSFGCATYSAKKVDSVDASMKTIENACMTQGGLQSDLQSECHTKDVQGQVVSATFTQDEIFEAQIFEGYEINLNDLIQKNCKNFKANSKQNLCLNFKQNLEIKVKNIDIDLSGRAKNSNYQKKYTGNFNFELKPKFDVNSTSCPKLSWLISNSQIIIREQNKLNFNKKICAYELKSEGLDVEEIKIITQNAKIKIVNLNSFVDIKASSGELEFSKVSNINLECTQCFIYGEEIYDSFKFSIKKYGYIGLEDLKVKFLEGILERGDLVFKWNSILKNSKIKLNVNFGDIFLYVPKNKKYFTKFNIQNGELFFRLKTSEINFLNEDADENILVESNVKYGNLMIGH
jgi:hypothetical protein